MSPTWTGVVAGTAAAQMPVAVRILTADRGRPTFWLVLRGRKVRDTEVRKQMARTSANLGRGAEVADIPSHFKTDVGAGIAPARRHLPAPSKTPRGVRQPPK